MGRTFAIPESYRSSLVSTIKKARAKSDPRKKDLSPTAFDLGRVRFKFARHFGFCFGVENAIEIAFRAIEENPDKRIFLLSEMIHNPSVNKDLVNRGVKFLLATDGTQLIPFSTLNPEDIVIVPAFGTSVELFGELTRVGIDPQIYNATCPFVEKVWTRSRMLGEQGFTVIIHGKHYHEETRATFSHARLSAPSVVIRDMKEATDLAAYIKGEREAGGFFEEFKGRHSEGFLPDRDLKKIGVVNQTTMLAHETQAISDFLKNTMREAYPGEEVTAHFADTRDTLCYATAENQNAVHELVKSGGDLAVVIGGYNSSNTSHLATICSRVLPTFYVKDADEILSGDEIRHIDIDSKEVRITSGWLPKKEKLDILVTAGASSPDSLVDEVISKIAGILGVYDNIPSVVSPFSASLQ